MPFYKYKYTKGGKQFEDTKEFENKEALYASVRMAAGSILSVKEVRSKKTGSFLSFKKRIKPQELITFAGEARLFSTSDRLST